MGAWIFLHERCTTSHVTVALIVMKSSYQERLLVLLPMFTTNSVSRSMSSGNPILATWLLCSCTISHWIFLLIAKSTTPKSRNLKHQHYDSHLSATLQKVHSLVDQINKTAEDSISVYLAYAVFSLSLLKLHSCHDYCL